ncbi:MULTISPECIES: sulfurtransferase/chromate resistance protein [unclassified Ensifer]|uniref:chromate resistance protein ChrB domain-containing protein n=1 Tax=unclassified Ensifer TaxID=2633371 RepID=UPI0008138F8A|nr:MULTISPECIES: sulfurtransferase/chromate resistance protein [unclassified Ensifer]OCO98409.1 sulfurtransferase [Ensifer sp. LC11]OCP05528.1 sulfurtransferase [Ensifer sp. LC14]OCP05616.1 sulfurtransferase [Ensifer sp. LC13]OCP30786.1 sulfurtransferase [Ensifer sp. LC499]
MSSFLEISPEKLARLIGTPNCPELIDVRVDEDFAVDPRLIPGSGRSDYHKVQEWMGTIGKTSAVIICQQGKKLSHGVAAWLRHAGIAADVLEGGFEAWTRVGYPAVPISALPDRDAVGRTVWVTRARPKIDRIACPWLIRRFVDPKAVFLFVTPAEAELVGQRFGATPFDIDAPIRWSHRGELCTFDVMVEEFGLATEPLLRLATIVRGADTARLDLAPEAPGLLAASLGLSRMYADDLEQLEAGMLLYDAFYRWCRDATNETHNWPSPKKDA